jgi:hypothetical protein
MDMVVYSEECDGNRREASRQRRSGVVINFSAATAWSAAVAADAAQDRAADCHRRLQDLRSRRPIQEADAQRARDRLARARARFAAADTRRRGRAMQAAERAVARGGTITATRETPSHIQQRLQEHGIPLSALFDSYFALGGVCGLIEVDAYVHGLAELPPGEVEIVQHAFWELIELAKD